MNDDELYEDLNSLPEPALEQLQDFIGHLKEKYNLIEASQPTIREFRITEEE